MTKYLRQYVIFNSFITLCVEDRFAEGNFDIFNLLKLQVLCLKNERKKYIMKTCLKYN